MAAISLNKTRLIAHRGLSGVALENTKEAITLAASNDRFYAVECDIRYTKDGKIVLCHDKSLKRLADIDADIASVYYDDIKSIKLINPFPRSSDKKPYIATFETYLQICKKYNKKCVIDIKFKNKKYLNKILDIIEQYMYLKNCIFICFVPKVLAYLRKKLPKSEMHLLINKKYKQKLGFCLKNNFVVSYDYRLLNKNTIEKLHAKKLKVSCFTVNDIDILQDLINRKIDYITTDYDH